MEYLEGKTYHQLLREATRREKEGVSVEMPVTMRLTIIANMLVGLRYAHSLKDFNGEPLNLVHRDVNPQNLFVTYTGHSKLLDFGIAKLEASRVKTATGVIKGKISYLAPEQTGIDTIDHRTDIFSVGVMIWEAIAGHRMWGKDPQTATILRRLLRGDLPDIREACPGVADELVDICAQALAIDKDERYPSVAVLERNLRRYLATEPPISVETIAKFMNELFADDRARTRGIIERE
jgi:serine/threonine-protein kinase